MKMSIDDAKCLDCGICEESLPQYFGKKDGKVYIKEAELSLQDEERARELSADCPGEALELGEEGKG
jgi:ferredoxin